MFKRRLLLIGMTLFFFSSGAYAFSFFCQQINNTCVLASSGKTEYVSKVKNGERCIKIEGFYTSREDWLNKFTIQGYMEKEEKQGKPVFSLTRWMGNYFIDQEGFPWSVGNGKLDENGKSLQEDLTYRPRKYRNHSRFKLDMNYYNHYGIFDFIFPKQVAEENGYKNGSEFKAYLTMTHVDDHHGTTVPLRCIFDW